MQAGELFPRNPIKQVKQSLVAGLDEPHTDGTETPGLDLRIVLSLNPLVVALHQQEQTTANTGYYCMEQMLVYMAKLGSGVSTLGK